MIATDRLPTASDREPSAARWLGDRLRGPMMRGSVLFHVASHAFQARGGGENQLLQTGRQLERLGVSVRPFSPWVDSLADARLVHLFGMSHEGLELARVARARKIPIVLSPICWYEPRAIRALATSRPRCAWELAKWGLRALAPCGLGWRGALLEQADAILPNSRAEASQLIRMFRVDSRKIHVVANGVEPRFATADPALFRSRFGAQEFVLYVGRIEPRKNVLGLIRGLRRPGLPLVAIGDVVPGHEPYGAHCRRLAGASARWLPRVEHDDQLLESAYAAARVFALPSWFETPGLAALEAAAAGCPVVVTPYGCTREYFGDRVSYAAPSNFTAIGRAVAGAWNLGPAEDLAVHVVTSFPWSEVARQTAEVYDRIAG